MNCSKMSLGLLGVLIVVLTGLNASSAPNALAATDVIADGGFESGELIAALYGYCR